MKRIAGTLILMLLIVSLTAGCSKYKRNDSSEKTQEEKSVQTTFKENELKIDYSNPSQDRYKDGVYHGKSSGKESGLYVTVTVTDGKIAQVVVDSHNETKGYSDDAIKVTPLRIVAKNSVEVDSVTGVTESVRGICDAVSKVLKDAKLK